MPQIRKSNKKYDRIFRTVWRVTSPHRPSRTETYDVSFPPGQEVHKHLSRKLEHAKRQLEQHTLRHGDELEFSKVYFISSN